MLSKTVLCFFSQDEADKEALCKSLDSRLLAMNSGLNVSYPHTTSNLDKTCWLTPKNAAFPLNTL